MHADGCGCHGHESTTEHAGHVPADRRPCCRRAGGAGRGALVEPAALAALLVSGSHGYDLRRSIMAATGGVLDVDAGGLYRILRRLEAEGFVVSTWEESPAGPAKREYGLTAEGRELAEGWRDHLRERQRMSGLVAEALDEALRTAPSGGTNDRHDHPDTKEN